MKGQDMAHQEGQPEELVVSQAEQETVEEELLDAVTGGGIKDFFRGCVRCFNPQTQETPGSPHAQQTPAGPSAQQPPVSGGTGVWLPAERRFLTQAEFNVAYRSPSPQPHPGTSSLGSSSSATSSPSNHSVRLEPR